MKRSGLFVLVLLLGVQLFAESNPEGVTYKMKTFNVSTAPTREDGQSRQRTTVTCGLEVMPKKTRVMTPWLKLYIFTESPDTSRHLYKVESNHYLPKGLRETSVVEKEKLTADHSFEGKLLLWRVDLMLNSEVFDTKTNVKEETLKKLGVAEDWWDERPAFMKKKEQEEKQKRKAAEAQVQSKE